jgi:hypothetical protein
VRFDPSGNQLVILYFDGTGLVWDVNPDHWKQRACSVAGRSLTQEEWEELLPRTELPAFVPVAATTSDRGVLQQQQWACATWSDD